MRIRPVIFVWTDEGVMRPLGRFMALAQKQFVIGEEIAMAPVEEVSQMDRGKIFARCRRIWELIDGEWGEWKYPSVEHLRKWVLVEAGHCTQAEYALSTPEDAKQMAIALRKQDEFVRMAQHENVLVVRTAKSIAAHAIKSVEFKALKRKVDDILSMMGNTTPAELEREVEADTKPNKDYRP